MLWLKMVAELSEGCPEQYLRPCLTKMTPASNPCSGGSSGIWHLLFEFPAKPNCLPDRNSSSEGHPKSLIYSSWGHYPSKIRCQSSDPLLPFWVLNLTVSCLLVHWYSATYFIVIITLLSCPDDRHYMDSWGSDKASRLKDKNYYFYLGLSHRVYIWLWQKFRDRA